MSNKPKFIIPDSATFAAIAQRAANSAKQIQAEFGILPNFISTETGTLPDSTGAVADTTKGAYFTDDDIFQLVLWDGDAWQDVGEPISTKKYVDDKASLSGSFINVKDAGATGDGTTDDSPAIQQALNSGAKIVYVPDGVYNIANPLTIKSDTHLKLTEGAVVKRAGEISYLLGNEVSGQGLYDDAKNIKITGGTWDGVPGTYSTNMSIFAFAHVDGVHIESCILTDIDNFHHIEWFGCRNIKLLNCVIKNFTGPVQDMVQIDQARSSESFPYYTVIIDDTPCVDVLIKGNTFRSGKRAVVSHFSANSANRRIRILNNDFSDFTESTTIILTACDDVQVSGNNFENVQRGITVIDNVAFVAGAPVTRRGFVITDNTFTNLNSAAASHAIRIESTQGEPNRTQIGVVSGNTVFDSKRHGILAIFTYGWNISNNAIQKCDNSGIILDGCQNIVCSGNNVTQCAEHGIRVTRSPRCTITSNHIWENGKIGLSIDNGSGDVLVHNNYVYNNSTSDTGSFNGIIVTGSCNRLSIQGNIIRGATNHLNGISIATANCNDCLVTNNDLLNAGITDFLDNGTGTITVAGNRT